MLQDLETIPLQTYYIPFPETNMLYDFFIPIKKNVTKGYVRSIIAVAISTDNTIIWYDHWEDGFDTNPANATVASRTTEVWGDGNATNGCQPAIASCTDTTDALNAGMSFVIQNNVVVSPRDRNVIRWDGGDKVVANFPIAITRGGYPEKPGSLLAGAVEVLDTSNWGTSFITPVGPNTPKASWEYTAFLFMAKEPNTTVTMRQANNSTLNGTYILQEGESRLVRTLVSQTLLSNKPIQVDIITGDIDSEYESRWYSLLDFKHWSTDYITPTGETKGRTKLVLYNPTTKLVSVTMETLNANGSANITTFNLNPKLYTLSRHVMDGTGARVKGNSSFITLSITDTELKSADGQVTGGQWYDWGFPVQPTADLTAQVLVAWGYVKTS
jgi:hypothetical protein